MRRNAIHIAPWWQETQGVTSQENLQIWQVSVSKQMISKAITCTCCFPVALLEELKEKGNQAQGGAFINTQKSDERL